MYAKPRTKETTMPDTATYNEVRPELSRSLGLISRPTVKKQEDGPNAGDGVDGFVRGDQMRAVRANYYAGQDFSYDGGQAEPLKDFAKELGADKNNKQLKQK